MTETLAATSVALSNNWQWSERDLTRDVAEQSDSTFNSKPDALGVDRAKSWRDCAAFPSEIHVELMRAGIIPDPYLGFNEHKVQCEPYLLLVKYEVYRADSYILAGVGEREWLYRTSFDFSSSQPLADLIFDGLDTFCTVYLVSAHI